MFLAFSVSGNVYHGYYFAFHLLHIINTNVLLDAAIKAVTVNGTSLIDDIVTVLNTLVIMATA